MSQSFDGAVSNVMCVYVCVCVLRKTQSAKGFMIDNFTQLCHLYVCMCVQGIIVSLHHGHILLFLSAISDISAYTPLYIPLEGVCVCMCVWLAVTWVGPLKE